MRPATLGLRTIGHLVDVIDVHRSVSNLLALMTLILAASLTPLAIFDADMQQAQLLMVAGFVMLGWVLARRQIKMRRRVNQETRVAHRRLKEIREHKEPALPLSDAPVQTQRWQAAMFDLQRELKADLDTRIAIVQALLRQVDQRIEQLQQLDPGFRASPTPTQAPLRQQEVKLLLNQGHTAEEIASQMGLPLGDVEMAIATLR